jgi:hypothetical protein
LNLSGSGVGVSFGGRGAHVGISSRGRRYVSASIPGTGLSHRQTMLKAPAPQCGMCQDGHFHIPAWLVFAIFILVAAISMLPMPSR